MNKIRTATIATLGCKVNQLESAAFQESFEKEGIKIVCEKEGADIIVINTCTVTETASKQSRQKLRRLLRNNPEAEVCITGCYAEAGKDELMQLPELEGRTFTIFGNSHKEIIVPSAIAGLSTHDQLGNISTVKEISRLPLAHCARRTRAYLRIQDGCNAFCSYCIVPYTRGRSRSLPPDEVISQAKEFALTGHKEIVLTGIHLGYYGVDLAIKTDLVSLIEQLLDVLPEIRFRISSLEPVEIDDRLRSLIASAPNLMPHLHIPLQSGNDEILHLMNRRYDTATFRDIIDRCHDAVPGLAIGIDILAGFPHETEERFQAAVDFLRGLDFTYLHVFPYSKRPGTPAAEMDGQVKQKEKERRVAILRELSNEKHRNFYISQLGKTHSVLFEGKRDKEGLLKGFSDNYLDVRVQGADSLKGTVADVYLERYQDGVILGIVKEE